MSLTSRVIQYVSKEGDQIQEPVGINEPCHHSGIILQTALWSASKNPAGMVDAQQQHNNSALEGSQVDAQQQHNNSALEGSQMADTTRKEVVIGIRAMLAGAEAPLSKKCCIYKVPHGLRKLNEDAYTPKVVSIGPFHHGKFQLRNTEKQKWIFLKRFTNRTNRNLDSLYRYVESVEPEIRDCYSEKIELSKEELIKIILVDACFILELFIWAVVKDWNDRPSLNSWLFDNVVQDLLLLENQIPFFVLEELFKQVSHRLIPLRRSLLDLTFWVFDIYNFQQIAIQSVAVSPLHFTDLLRTFYLQPDKCPTRSGRKEKLNYAATELHEAGVKLKVNKRSPGLLSLKFSSGVLEIPQLSVEDSTEMLFRNMLALEQCTCTNESYITDYVIVLDYLINMEKDVDLLVRKGIVRNWLGDNKAVAEMINGLGKNIFLRDLNNNYNDLCTNLNSFCANACNIRKATLRRDYCKTPWQTAASLAAILILIMTLIQTVCSLYQLIRGH